MSYDIYLRNDDGTIAQVERHSEGGTYLAGGTTDAELNVTYNYSFFLYEHLDKDHGICWLSGKKAGDTIERMERAVAALGTVRDPDYWKATAGNTGFALSILLRWAKQYPEAVWEGQ